MGGKTGGWALLWWAASVPGYPSTDESFAPKGHLGHEASPICVYLEALEWDAKSRVYIQRGYRLPPTTSFSPEVSLRGESVPSVITYPSYVVSAPRVSRGCSCIAILPSLVMFLALLLTRRGAQRRPTGAICGQMRSEDAGTPSRQRAASKVLGDAPLLAK